MLIFMKLSIIHFRCLVSHTNVSLTINFSKMVCHIFIKAKILWRILTNQTKEEKFIKHLIPIPENKHGNSARNETDQSQTLVFFYPNNKREEWLNTESQLLFENCPGEN